MKALVQLPRAAMEGDYQAATIYEARPYITGCTSGDVPYGEEGYDISKLYSQPEARTPVGEATTEEVAAEPTPLSGTTIPPRGHVRLRGPDLV